MSVLCPSDRLFLIVVLSDGLAEKVVWGRGSRARHRCNAAGWGRGRGARRTTQHEPEDVVWGQEAARLAVDVENHRGHA